MAVPCVDKCLVLRALADSLVSSIDEKIRAQIKKEGELLPGGDIRILGNQWVRGAFRDAALSRVPRENQVRLALRRVVSKAKLSSSLRIYVALFALRLCPTFLFLLSLVCLHDQASGKLMLSWMSGSLNRSRILKVCILEL